ncbi:MAG TPA: alpha/beta hydrolase-fold protein [Candidatus Aminicenantes bacterium]|nr:alpha/beta hydrolase-fold protein [Candidatus Aminicenantes bacterium]HRY64395.1 alpha/beta hydrolase-fold protein [Candidatus Aminicenantes bacterium]HRZ71308.1 alpha/beta hydrolase-fold protein [Candidatus Aminicenantes bacterium]
MKHRHGLILFGLLVLVLSCAPPAAEDIVFHVLLDPAVIMAPVSGRLKVCLDSNALHEPAEHLEENYSDPEPFYYRDVENWRPGETVTIDKTAQAFFTRLEKLPRRRYAFQAILEPKDPARGYNDKTGILWGPVVIEKLVPGRSYVLSLVLKNIVGPFRFPESETAKEIVVPSPLLSHFYGRPIDLRAAVVLPATYAKEPACQYPAVYVIPGLFGSYRAVEAGRRRYGMNGVGTDKIYVILDADCPLGHHTFCDSENNGPRAASLVTELIPAIEKTFRVLPEPGSRFLTGQSSGAWSALWLQVTYPEFFGGVWAASPDPVDFRNFCYAGDLYEPGANMYYERDGRERPFWMFRGYPICTMKEFWEMEDASGTASQIQSWEAAWSPRGKDGRPRPFFDRTTGIVDPETISWWKRYDIARVLQANWPEIGKRLRGKIRVFAGDHDDYALNKAVLGLKDVLKTLGAEAVVEILPGNHVLWSEEFTARVQKEMDAALAVRAPQGSGPSKL